MNTIRQIAQIVAEPLPLEDIAIGTVFRFMDADESHPTYMRVNNPYAGTPECHYVDLANGYLNCTDPKTDVIVFTACVSITRAMA